MALKADDYTGVHTALVTPFSEDGSQVDHVSLERLINFQMESGASGIVPCGSTGEAAALSESEFREVVATSVKSAQGKVPVTVGVTSNVTWKVVEQAKQIEELGADAVLLVVPFYNKPTQQGIIEHFRAVREAVSLPIVAYNVPSRTGTNMLPETVKTLADEDLVIALKEASGSMDQWLDLAAAVGEKISLLSGEDALIYSCVSTGGKGTISASANIIPKELSEIVCRALAQESNVAYQLQLKVLPLIRLMFAEPNPMPVKAALASKGIIASSTLRGPLRAVKNETLKSVQHALEVL